MNVPYRLPLVQKGSKLAANLPEASPLGHFFAKIDI